MAKRYHSSPGGFGKSSEESHGGKMDPRRYKEPRRGMEPHNFNYGPEQVAGTDPRRTQQMEDAGMIHMDPRAIANLPQEVMMKPYIHDGPYLPEGLDDTIGGVDHQMDYDDSKRAATFYPKKV